MINADTGTNKEQQGKSIKYEAFFKSGSERKEKNKTKM